MTRAGGASAPPAFFTLSVRSRPLFFGRRAVFRAVLFFFGFIAAVPRAAFALDAAAVAQLAVEDSDAKLAAIKRLVADGDVAALPLFGAMQQDSLYLFNGRVVFLADGAVKDALSGAAVEAPPEELQAVTVNNRIRSALDGAVAALQLASADRNERLAAARRLAVDAGEEILPILKRVLEKEADPEIRSFLAQADAVIEIRSADPGARRAAARLLGASGHPQAKQLLASLLQKGPDGSFAEPDAGVRDEAQKALQAVERRFFMLQIAGTLFSGLSLGSVLLLAALGLAITFGIMGIINMAHGEMLMLGAYATYVVQSLFRAYAPGAEDWYLVAAVPAAFIVAGLAGVGLERFILRFLYGRPLETLLTTWGLSLVIIQSVRVVFGAQNVEVANPSWLSGGFALGGDLVLPYNRIAIILFAAFVLLLVWLFLARTRLGLYVRAVTQNRTMADCMGIPTPRVDWITFGLGSGIAGLGGVALSQIGNVGPDLGQSYIVDSFMVVVLGGVGQLSGTIIAAIGLGEINKFLEPFTGAVLGKIFVLIIIILVIQKRPQGMFALKGRAAEI